MTHIFAPISLRVGYTETFTGAIPKDMTLVVSDSGWKPDILFPLERLSPREMAAVRKESKSAVFGIPKFWCEENGYFKTWPLPAAVCTVSESVGVERVSADTAPVELLP